MKRTLKVLLRFLSNLRHDVPYHLFQARDAWFDAEFELMLDETFATARREGWLPTKRGEG